MKSQIQKLLNKRELSIIRKLNSPNKIQDFIDGLPFNFERNGQTYMSPKKVLEKRMMHCFEGAIFGCLCLELSGIKNFLLDLKVKRSAKTDSDHTLCIFEKNGYWGAISKTNHSVLRWRDPIFVNFKELAKSYFHEYFLDSGEKTLESFSRAFDIWEKFGIDWIRSEEDLHDIAISLDESPHIKFVSLKNRRNIRRAGKTEIKGAAIEEWNKNGKLI